MQYVLSEEEYTNLLKLGREHIEAREKTLQTLCTMVADNMPATNGEPWGCMLSGNNCCDDCPVDNLCPYTYKDYSD